MLARSIAAPFPQKLGFLRMGRKIPRIPGAQEVIDKAERKLYNTFVFRTFLNNIVGAD
jgi:hypothetical protein